MQKKQKMSLTLISCNFGDSFWITHTINSYKKLTNTDTLNYVHISDQRSSGFGEEFPALTLTESELRVVIHPVQPSSINHSSVHHGNSIQFLLNEIDFSTTHIVLSDSDCFPVNKTWLKKVKLILEENDAICSLDEDSNILTHPCFMVLPVEVAKKMNFLMNTKMLATENWFDTGRLIGVQLTNLGYRVAFLEPKKIFTGLSNSRYFLDNTIVHIGSASFRGLKLVNDLSYGSLADSKFSIPRYIVEHLKWLFNVPKLIRNIFFLLIWFFFTVKGYASIAILRLRRLCKR